MNEWVRAVRLADVDELLEMIRHATIGLTSLKLSRDQLLRRVERSHFAMTRQSTGVQGDPYVLVMQDAESELLIGTATVFSKVGGFQPFYTYRVLSETHQCESLGITPHQRSLLQLDRIHDGPSELGSLFLVPEQRGQGRGRFLSLSRFALMASRPDRFAKQVIAEMRGQCSREGVSPFYEHVMRPFFQVAFDVADTQSILDKGFIEELIPLHPLYLDLLPAEIRETIGAVNVETQPALHLLLKEGFQRTDWVDIFDAGPVVQCETACVRAIRECRSVTVEKVVDSDRSDVANSELTQPCIVASGHDGFTAMRVGLQIGGESIALPRLVAERLGVEAGSQVWRLPLDPTA